MLAVTAIYRANILGNLCILSNSNYRTKILKIKATSLVGNATPKAMEFIDALYFQYVVGVKFKNRRKK